jgi:release factor glutamine methyltransferase
MTVSQAIAHIRDRLDSVNLDNTAAESDWIVSHFLETDRVALHAEPDRILTADQEKCVREAADRRRRREPLQYVLGNVPFCDCVISVGPGVLIPRPETEWIVETVIERRSAASSILDIGTGSGAIAVALATRLPQATVTAIDLSDAALQIAQANAIDNEVSDRIRFLRGDLSSLPFVPGSFDLIISNPPYIRSSDMAALAPEILDHEPLLALEAGHDGLSCYQAIAAQSADLIRQGGRLELELPGLPPEPILELFQTHDYGPTEIENDWAGKPRLLTVLNST